MRLRRRPRSAGPIIGLVLLQRGRRSGAGVCGYGVCATAAHGQQGGWAAAAKKEGEGGPSRAGGGPDRPPDGGQRRWQGESWPGPAVRAAEEVCRRSRRHDFLGLTGTMLSDEAASLLAGALNILPDRD